MNRNPAAPAPPRDPDTSTQAMPVARTTLPDLAAAALLALGAAFERDGGRDTRRAWITAVPIVIVNYVAFRAQLRFWQAHLDRPDALLVSVALESIAIYWAYQAHQAVMADDSALRLKLAAYGMALVIGVLNYSHYMHPHWRPTVAAVTFGMMSVISPWLWSANSRRSSRDVLKAKGLIEDHAVRLGLTRWFWHAWKCTYVMWAATWTGENRPAEAIRLWELRKNRKAAGSQRGPDVPDVRKAARTPPPAPRTGEPRQPVTAVSSGRAAPVKGLEAVPARGLPAARNEAEAALVRQLIENGRPFPPVRRLAEDEALTGSESTRRRRARDLIALAAAGVNGVNGHHV